MIFIVLIIKITLSRMMKVVLDNGETVEIPEALAALCSNFEGVKSLGVSAEKVDNFFQIFNQLCGLHEHFVFDTITSHQHIQHELFQFLSCVSGGDKCNTQLHNEFINIARVLGCKPMEQFFRKNQNWTNPGVFHLPSFQNE